MKLLDVMILGLQQSAMVGSYTIGFLGGMVVLQLLWFHCAQFNWPMLSNAANFRVLSALLTFVHLLNCRRLFRHLGLVSFSILAYSLWVLVILILLVIVVSVQLALGIRKSEKNIWNLVFLQQSKVLPKK